MWFNGYTLRFYLREFAIVFSLNCVASKDDFVFDTSVLNRLLQKYFGGEEEPYKATLFQAFEDQVWSQNDDDALKIVILYFINRFIMPGKMHTIRVPRFHFDVVEQGRHIGYCWSKQVKSKFQSLRNLTNDNHQLAMDAIKSKDDHEKNSIKKSSPDEREPSFSKVHCTPDSSKNSKLYTYRSVSIMHPHVGSLNTQFDKPPDEVVECTVERVEGHVSHMNLQIVDVPTDISIHSHENQDLVAAPVHIADPLEFEQHNGDGRGETGNSGAAVVAGRRTKALTASPVECERKKGERMTAVAGERGFAGLGSILGSCGSPVGGILPASGDWQQRGKGKSAPAAVGWSTGRTRRRRGAAAV
ncbi:hypothetical protein FXO38_01602 [Capsicum annuum]|nr:hypothetical protein FXO38_01602 [Capsicum annuum]